MNNSYKLVYSEALNTWVAVAEHVSARGKKSAVRLVTAAALLAGGAVGTGWALAAPPLITPPAVNQLPTGGQVAAGTVNISQTQTATAASMLVQQSSNRAIVNWQSFNVGANAKVNISQPSSSSVLLNRVLDTNPTQIFGQINANGQVFLTNPNGVYFAPGSSVDVGSFTATTHSISDADFLAGKYNFNRNGATGSIVNEGNISAGFGSYIALLAPEVRNQGVVVAKVGGNVAMAAGESYQLQFNSNNQLTNVLVTPSTVETLVENGNAVLAPGGLIIMSAQAASSLLGGVVKNSGSISATGLVNDGGTIRLTATNKIELTSTSTISADAAHNSAGNGGRIDIITDLGNATGITHVDGSISAKGGAQGGDGGFIETSANRLTIANSASVTAEAFNGTAGTWLLDPYDFTVASSGGDVTGAAIQTALATTDVTIQTNAANVACTNVTCASGTSSLGDIYIKDSIAWSSSKTLTLNAYNNIYVGTSTAGGSLTLTGTAKLVMVACGGNTTCSAYYANPTSGVGSVLMGMAGSPTSGLLTNQNGFNGQINVSSTATNPIIINGRNYTVINDVAGLTAITTSAAGTNHSGSTNNGYYVLGSDITSALTSSIIATDYHKYFSGYFNGFGHTINVALTNGNMGLFSQAYSFVFSNLGVKGSIANTSSQYIGGIVGNIPGWSNGLNDGTILNTYNAANITSSGNNVRLAGIIGSTNYATLSNVYNTGSITVTSGTWVPNAGYVVGLVGYANKVIATNVYNTGAMSASTGQTVSGVAGLFGFVGGGSIITNAYNTGNITVGSNSIGIGGIFAIQNWGPSTFTNIYSSGAVTAGAGSTAVGIIGGMHFDDSTQNITRGFYNSSNASSVGGATITNPFGTVWTNYGVNNRLNCGTLCINSSPSATTYYSVTPLTTAQMTVSSSFTGFTFSSSAWGYSSVANSSPILCLFGGCVISNIYVGVSGGTWSTASNWSLLLAPLSTNASSYNNIVINSGSTVNLDTANVGSLTTTIANAGTISFTGSSNVTLSGAISGNGAINTAAGFTGSATLSGTNTYSGGTTISGGTLKAGSATAFGTGAISVASGAALDLNGQTMTSTGVLTLNGTGISSGGALTNSSSSAGTYAGNIALGSASSIGSAVGEITASGVVSGAFALTKVGAASLSLTGSNSYTGTTTISAGTLKVGSGSALGSSSGGAISVASLAALDLNGFSLANTNTITLNGTGINSGGALINSSVTGSAISNPIVLGSDTSIGSSTNSINLSGVVSGIGFGLTKTGSGSLILSGTNTYTGATTVSAGTLSISNAAGLGGTGAGTSVASGANLFFTVGFNVGAEAITLNGGTLRLQSGTGSLSGTVDLAANSSISVDSGAQLTLSGLVYGTGRLTKTSLGTLVLTGTNTYSGGTTISAGTLQLGAGGATGSIEGNVTNNATLAFNRSDDLTYANVISGTGAVTKSANNTLTFTGNNTYSGGTTISAGTLKAGSATALGTGAISVSNGAALDLNGQTMTSTGVLTLRGTGIDSTGALLNSGSTAATYAGALALGANSSIMSGSTITSTISLTNTGALAGGGFTLTLGAPGLVSADNHLYSIIDNTTAKIIKNGSFFWTFHGNNTYSGGTDINAGTIRAGSATALGSGAITVASGGSLDLRGQTMTSTGTLSLNGSGFANLGALRNSNATAATYAGPLVLTGNANVIAQTGAIQLTHTGTITGATFGLTLGGAQGGSIAAIIGTTTGSLTKQDGGTWTLSGANTYTGGTTISAGTLKLGSATAAGTGAIGVGIGGALDLNGQTLTSTGALTLNSTGVANGGALLNSSSSAGTYAGAVTLASDSSYGGTGAITFGSTVNSVSSAAYALSSTSAGNLMFNAAVGASYALSSLSTGTGTTTLGANVTTVGAQTYGGPVVIKNSSGVTLANTNSAITFGATVNSISATSYALTLSNGTGATTFTGAIGATEAIGALTVNGTGIITVGGNVTTKGDQTYAGPVSASAGIVINANSTAGTTGILTNGYINNTNYAVAVQTAGSFPNEPGEYNIQTGTSNAIIGTTGTIRGNAVGVLFYNTTNIEGADNGMASGSPSSSWCCYNVPYLVDVGRSTLLTKISVSQRAGDGQANRLPTKVYVYGSNTPFTTSATMLIGYNNSNISNVSVLGTGYQQSNFTEIGNGTLSPALTTSSTPALGSVSFTNTTAYRYYQIAFVSAGQTTVAGSYARPLALQAINLVGSAYTPSSVTFNGAVTASGALTVNTTSFSAANMTAGGAITINNSGTGSVTGVISTNGSNAASLVKQGDGTLTLSNTNTYTGGTTVSAGTLQVGAGVATGSIEGNVTNNATLAFNRSDDVTYAGAISGTGTVTKLAANTLSFTGTNTYTGGTTISAGTLQIGAGGSTGSMTGDVTNNATLALNRSGALSFSGAISGTGSVTKLGSGTTTLSGVNTYTGLTTVSTGTLAISNAAGLGGTATGTTVASGATLDLQGVAVGAEAITLQGGTLATSTGTSSLSGAVTLGADSTINVAGSASQLTISGLVTGASKALTKSGTGNLILTARNTFSGGMTIAAGTATEGTTYDGTSGPLGSGTVYVPTGGTLDTNAYNIAVLVSLGGGSLVNNSTVVQNGAGDISAGVTLTANSIFGGVGKLNAWTQIQSNGYGLAFVGSGYKNLSNTSNTLTSIASGADVGQIAVTNNQDLTIGSVTVGSTPYTGLSSTGTILVKTITGNLTVNNNVVTSSTSSNVSSPAIELAAGYNDATTSTTNNLVLGSSASSLITAGSGAAIALYSGTPTSSSYLSEFATGQTTKSITYSKTTSTRPSAIAGYYVMYRGSQPNLYVIYGSSGSSTYGSAPDVTYTFNTLANGSGTSYISTDTSTLNVTGTALFKGTYAPTGTTNVSLNASANAGNYTDVTYSSGLSSPIYTLTAGTGTGTFTINKANAYVIVTPGQSSTYGATPTLNYTFNTSSAGTGTPISASPAGLSGSASITNAPTAGSNAGTYSLRYASGLSSTNYEFNGAANSTAYTVNQAQAFVIINAGQSSTYGSAPSIGYTFNTSSAGTGSSIDASLAGLSGTATITNAPTPTSNAGSTYNLTYASGLSSTNYAFLGASNATSYTVNKAPLNLAISKTYNGASTFTNANTYSFSGTRYNGDAAPTITSGSASTSSSNAATYTSLSSNSFVLSNTNYTLTGGTVAATINPKQVSVTNASRNSTYDGVTNYNTLAAGTSYSVGTMVGSDSVASVTQTPSGLTGASTGAAQAGTFTVTPSTAVLSTGLASNYAFSFVPSTHTVDKANLSVSATPSLTGNVYKGSAFTGTYTTTAVNGETFTVAGQATGTNAGTYTSALTVSGAALANYNTPVITDANLVISPKPVTISNEARTSAYNGLSTYSDLANAISFNVNGLIGLDAVRTVTQTPGNSVVAGNAANAGTFTVMPSAAVLNIGRAENYTFNYTAALATVSKVNLTVKANNDGKFVGESDNSAYGGVSYTGFVAGQTASVLSGAVAVNRSNASVNAPGTYTGVLSAASSTLSSTNYNITYEAGNYTIIPADQLLIRLADASTTYGTAPSYTLSSVQYKSSTGGAVVDLTNRAAVNSAAFTLSDGAGGNTALTLGPLSTTLSNAGQVAVGSYQVGATSITNTSANYSNTVNIVGALKVEQKNITATATSGLSKTYDGTTNMTSLGLGLTGLVGSDVVSASGLGSYANANAGNNKSFSVSGINLAGTDAANYKLASNTLTATTGVITQASLLIKAKNDSKSYDAIAYSPANAVTAGVDYSGFVNGETSSVLSGTLSYGGTAIGAVNVGNYVIEPTGQTSSNYAITYGNGALSISPADVRVSATNVALTGTVGKVYDGTNVATLTSNNYVTTGWQGSDGATITQTTGTYDNANAGVNKLVNVTLASSDYNATNGTLLSNYNLPTSASGYVGVITPKSVTVSNASRSTTYDGVTSYNSLAAGTTYTVGAMVGADAVSSISQTASGFSGGASGTAQAGTYMITPSTAVMGTGSASNYSFSYVGSTHTVNKATLNLVISKTYDGTNSFSNANANSYTFTGMVNSEAAPSLSAGAATTSSADANSYSSFATNTLALSDGNYTLTGGTVVATITPKPVSVTNTARSTTYDGVTNYNSLASGTAFTVSAMVGSDAVATVTQTSSGYTGSATGTAQAGSFTVTPSAAILGNGSASNYSFSFVPSTHTVDKANLSVSATPSLSGNVYNGNAFTGSYTTTALNGETFTVTGQATGINAGTYASAMNVSGSALANYNTPVITNANFVINPKPVTVTNTDRTTTYDGVSTYAALAGGTSFTTSTMVGNDAVGSLTQTPSSNGAANTGTFTVTPSAAALSTGTASNYDFTYVPSTHTVNKAALTLTASTNTKNFDGKTDAQAIPTVSGLKGSDTVSNLVEAYSDVNPGTGKTLTVQAGYQISDGNQGRNYTVTLVPDQTGEIRAQAVAVLPPEAPSASNNSYAPPTLTLFAASATVAPASSVSSSSSASSSSNASSSSVSVGSSSGVVVNTINSPTTQVNGLVAVLVPSGTATAGTGLVIALPEQVLTSNAASTSVQVTLPNNEPLPSWIRYDAATQTLVTTAVPTGAFPLSVVVTVDGKSTIIQISESKTNP